MIINQQKGVTLIEVLVAIFVVVTGLIGSLTLVTQVMQFTSLSSSKLIASYLAQEGVEIVRNIRDQAWLDGSCDNICFQNIFNDGDFQASYNDLSLEPFDSNEYLTLAGDYYEQQIGSGRFQRRINIVNDVDPDDANIPIIKVTVNVSWDQIGDQKIEVQENLYNWR